MIYFLIILLLILLLFIFGIIFFMIVNIIEALLTLGKPNAPFVSIPVNILEKISENILIKNDFKVCDLGSGDGRILFHLALKNNNASFVGIERSLFPFVLCKLKLFIKGFSNIKFKRENFFNSDFSDFDIFITYLYPSVMNSLLPKLEKEIKKGSTIYSIDFQFENKKPESIINLGGQKNRGEKLYIYKF